MEEEIENTIPRDERKICAGKRGKMIGYFRRTISLSNLCSGKPKAQIATLLILIMVIILISILVTVNIGQISLNTTQLANAADNASLYLGSLLATKSHMLWVALDEDDEICRATFWLALVLSIPFGPIVGFAVAGSLYGGGWEGAAKGAVQGFTLALAVLGSIFTGQWWMVALVVSSIIYNGAMSEKDYSDYISKAVKSLNGLPEKERYQEGTILQAFMQTVEDPTMIKDIADSDGDGDTEEMIPQFFFWWDQRMQVEKGHAKAGMDIPINNFLAALNNFEDFVQQQYQPGNFLSRQEIEGRDGALVELARALRIAGRGLSIWEPGPLLAVLTDWEESGSVCDSCSPPAGYDEVDAAIYQLKDFVKTAEEIKGKSLEELIVSWRSWVSYFYDPEDDVGHDYYYFLNDFIHGDAEFSGLAYWNTEIENRRSALPVCIYGELNLMSGSCDPCGAACSNNCITNPPCRQAGFGTIDQDLEDEFVNVRGNLNNLIAEIDKFRAASKAIYDDINSLLSLSPPGGENPATYSWQDSRGRHNIIVEVGPFNLPRVKKEKKWYKQCIKLKDHDGSVRVKITRGDPANKSLNILGIWNPYDPDGDGMFSVSRTSNMHYSQTSVGVVGTK